MLKQSFKSVTTVSTTTFTTFLTETKEGGEERKRLSLLPSSLVLVRNVFPGNLFNSFDSRIGRVGWVTKIFTRFPRVFPSELSRGGVLPYMGYIGMCCCEGYGFQAVYFRIGYINQNIWV